MKAVAPLHLPALGMVCALGESHKEILSNLLAGSRVGMMQRADLLPARSVRVGAVSSGLPDIICLPPDFRSRNNQLLLAALAQIRTAVDSAITQYGHGRVAVVLGSSTSGVSDGEAALAHREEYAEFPAGYCYQQQEMGNPAQCLVHYLKLENMAYTISTACSSSGKAMAAAARLLHAGLCDAVLCGGVDSLCRMTVQGFAALESVAQDYCNPFMAARDGINLGEGAALFLMTRENLFADQNAIVLLGAGEASDAFHMSAPDPEGHGAEQAITAAMRQAGLNACDISYINLHGTATRKNDEMEAALIARLFGGGVPCSSTKSLTGHTLGAAGAIEAGLCWLSLSPENIAGKMPPHIADGIYDAGFPALKLCQADCFDEGAVSVMSNSFAFGGSNVSLIMGRTS